MILGPDAQRIRPQLIVWWIIWVSILTGQILIYWFLGRGPLPPPVPGANPLVNLIAFVPLFVSIVIRWLVLPRATDPKAAFVMFVVGLALADSCSMLGIFLGGPYREDFFVLGVLATAQFVPFYARKFFEPKGSGFIPNN